MDSNKFSLLNQLPEIRSTLATNPDAAFQALRSILHAHSMPGFEIELLGRLLKEVSPADVTEFNLCRIAILSNYTVDPLANVIRVGCLKEGHFIEIYEAPFDSCKQEILSDSSGLYAFNPDMVVIANSYHEFASLPRGPMDKSQIEEALNNEVEIWQGMWSLLNERIGKPILQNLCETSEQEYLGIAERRAEWSVSRFVENLNIKFVDSAPSFVTWIDVETLAARVGKENWHDPRLYHHGKIGFSAQFLPEYMSLFNASFRSALGKTKKALILDLDNTLWGGVIGDDGLNGISLGPDSAEGEAYYAFCAYIKNLGQRGVVLGICSKNELDIATEVFEKHPHMPLNLNDFAAVYCNWNDKASNLTNIAKELNIDISTLVFVDDNPAECELIRQQLPEVCTLQLEGDPSLFIRQLDFQHLFDIQRFSDADLTRSESYQARAKSATLLASTSNLDDYLTSLDMKALIKEASVDELKRLAQMEMKTNQFNLSTRRLSLEQLQSMSESPEKKIFAIFLTDCFADHGLISYVATEVNDSKFVVTDWLMSCRVFGRTLEEYIFNNIVKLAQVQGISNIEITYNPTAKNKVMENLFEKLQFSCVSHYPEGPWHFTVSNDWSPLKCVIRDNDLSAETKCY